MDNKMVTVRNTINSSVGINVPSLNFRKEWIRKDSIQKIPFEVLEQIIYDTGVEYMFKSGMLYIEDMEVKIALGLEEEKTVQPTNIKYYSTEDLKKLLTQTPLKDFREEVETMTDEQVRELGDVAVEILSGDYQRNKIIQDRTGMNINKMIQMEIESAEADKKEKEN